MGGELLFYLALVMKGGAVKYLLDVDDKRKKKLRRRAGMTGTRAERDTRVETRRLMGYWNR